MPRTKPFLRAVVSIIAGTLITATALLVPHSASAKSGSGYGKRSEAAFLGPVLGTSGTFALRLSGYATENARNIDTAGYIRMDLQPQRLFTDRPVLDEKAAFINLGIHGGMMPLELGPLSFGAGFGFDMMTVGVMVKDKVVSEAFVPFGLELAVGLRMWTWGRMLFTYQAQIVGASAFNDVSRQGFTLEIFVGFGKSDVYLLLAMETGTFSAQGMEDFSGGQALIGLTYMPL